MVLARHIGDTFGIDTHQMGTCRQHRYISVTLVYVLSVTRRGGSLPTYIAQLPLPVPMSRICLGFFPTGALKSGFSRSESKMRASK